MVIGYKTSSNSRILSSLNSYELVMQSGNEKLLIPNMHDYLLKGIQFKTSLQFLPNTDDYKNSKIILGLGFGLSSNHSSYYLFLSDSYKSNYYEYLVDEKYLMGSLEGQVGWNQTFFKRFDLAGYIIIGRNFQSPKPRYEVTHTFPMLGYNRSNLFINIKFDLTYSFNFKLRKR